MCTNEDLRRRMSGLEDATRRKDEFLFRWTVRTINKVLSTAGYQTLKDLRARRLGEKHVCSRFPGGLSGDSRYAEHRFICITGSDSVTTRTAIVIRKVLTAIWIPKELSYQEDPLQDRISALRPSIIGPTKEWR